MNHPNGGLLLHMLVDPSMRVGYSYRRGPLDPAGSHHGFLHPGTNGGSPLRGLRLAPLVLVGVC